MVEGDLVQRFDSESGEIVTIFLSLSQSAILVAVWRKYTFLDVEYKETEQIKSERATLILQSIEKSTQDRERIGIVFDPMRSEDKDWRTELLERFWLDSNVPFVSTRNLALQQGWGDKPLDLFREDGHPTTHFNRQILEELLPILHEIQETR